MSSSSESSPLPSLTTPTPTKQLHPYTMPGHFAKMTLGMTLNQIESSWIESSQSPGLQLVQFTDPNSESNSTSIFVNFCLFAGRLVVLPYLTCWSCFPFSSPFGWSRFWQQLLLPALSLSQRSKISPISSDASPKSEKDAYAAAPAWQREKQCFQKKKNI